MTLPQLASNSRVTHAHSLAGSLQYPPTDDAEFSQLSSRLAALSASSTGLTARSCLYYLSLAFSPSAEAAAAVAKDLLLPPAFRLSIRAFHALDSGDYRAAVRLLADPRVTPDFVPRTLAILSTLPEPSERAELVLSYWRLARIDLAAYGKDEVKCVLKALCAPERARGVAEAWSLAREWREEGERAELAKTVLETCFGGRFESASFQSALLAHFQSLPQTITPAIRSARTSPPSSSSPSQPPKTPSQPPSARPLPRLFPSPSQSTGASRSSSLSRAPSTLCASGLQSARAVRRDSSSARTATGCSRLSRRT